MAEPESRAVGMREMTLTPEAAAQIIAMLEDDTIPTHRGVAVPESNPARLQPIRDKE